MKLQLERMTNYMQEINCKLIQAIIYNELEI